MTDLTSMRRFNLANQNNWSHTLFSFPFLTVPPSQWILLLKSQVSLEMTNALNMALVELEVTAARGSWSGRTLSPLVINQEMVVKVLSAWHKTAWGAHQRQDPCSVRCNHKLQPLILCHVTTWIFVVKSTILIFSWLVQWDLTSRHLEAEVFW